MTRKVLDSSLLLTAAKICSSITLGLRPAVAGFAVWARVKPSSLRWSKVVMAVPRPSMSLAQMGDLFREEAAAAEEEVATTEAVVAGAAVEGDMAAVEAGTAVVEVTQEVGVSSVVSLGILLGTATRVAAVGVGMAVGAAAASNAGKMDILPENAQTVIVELGST